MRNLAIAIAALLAAAFGVLLYVQADGQALPVASGLSPTTPIEPESTTELAAPEGSDSAGSPRDPLALPSAGTGSELSPATASLEEIFEERADELERKFKDWDYDRLQSHRRSLAKKIGHLASPITQSKLASGDYQELPPVSSQEEFDFDPKDYKTPGELEPIVSTAVETIDGTDLHRLRIVTVFPEQHPELKPLCEEKDWVTQRLRELYQEEKKAQR